MRHLWTLRMFPPLLDAVAAAVAVVEVVPRRRSLSDSPGRSTYPVSVAVVPRSDRSLCRVAIPYA